MSTRILLVEDHDIVRQGIRSLLEKEVDFEVVAEAKDGRAALEAARQHVPHVAVMDLTMPRMNGIEATRRMVAEVPGVKVVCLSVHAEERFVGAAVAAGAKAYVLKEYALEDLLQAIRTVLANQTYLCPRVAGTVVEAYTAGRSALASHNGESAFELLTAREREVLQLLAEGLTTKEIAGRLDLSPKTVGRHRERVMGKLGVRNLAGLVKYAVREGLTSIDV